MARRLDLGIAELDLTVLQARYQQRWRHRVWWFGGALLLLYVVGLMWSPLQQQIWGMGMINLTPSPTADMEIWLDEMPITDLTKPVLAGMYQLTIQRDRFYPVTVPVTVTRDQRSDVTVPLLRPRPSVQKIPLPAPGSTWQTIQADPEGGWRLTAQLEDTEQDETDMRSTLMRVTPTGVHPRPTLTLYPSADEVNIDGERFWASWEPLAPGNGARYGMQTGNLTIQTPQHTLVLTTTALSGLWWSPEATNMLLTRPRGLGQDLMLGTPRMRTMPDTLVRIPGVVQAVHWHPDGHAAVVLSVIPPVDEEVTEQPDIVEATLIIAATEKVAARAIRLAAPPESPAGLIPLAWSDDALWWPGQVGLDLVLDKVSLSTGFPIRQASLPEETLALKILPDETIILLVLQEDQLLLQRWPDGAPFVKMDDVSLPAVRPIRGQWQDNVLFLATVEDVWQLSFAPETIYPLEKENE